MLNRLIVHVNRKYHLGVSENVIIYR